MKAKGKKKSLTCVLKRICAKSNHSCEMWVPVLLCRKTQSLGLFVFTVSPRTIELCFEQLKYHATINTSKILRARIYEMLVRKKSKLFNLGSDCSHWYITLHLCCSITLKQMRALKKMWIAASCGKTKRKIEMLQVIVQFLSPKPVFSCVTEHTNGTPDTSGRCTKRSNSTSKNSVSTVDGEIWILIRSQPWSSFHTLRPVLLLFYPHSTPLSPTPGHTPAC